MQEQYALIGTDDRRGRCHVSGRAVAAPEIAVASDQLAPQIVMGTGRTKDARWFTALAEGSLDQTLTSIEGCQPNETWITDDQGPGRPNNWLNPTAQAASS